MTRKEPTVMPFKSQAQRRKFAALLVSGKISPQTFEEWNRETGGAKLPERVKPKRKPARRARAKSTRARSTSRSGRRTRRRAAKSRR